MTLYEAISVRKSVRKYNMKPIVDDKLELIMRFANSLPMLFPDIEVEFRILECTTEDKRRMYFNKHQPFMVNAPYYLILSSTKHDGYYINAGYLMEQVSLYLTSKDIGSCFLGATRLSDKVEINPSMEHVITLGFGGSNSKVHRIPNKQKRLAEKDIVTYKEDVSENIREIIEAARLSPSSNNNQPWRFVVYKNRIHIFCKKNLIKSNNSDKLKQIDIGVAIGNMLVAIDEMWLYAELLRLDNVSKKSFKDYEYVITLKLNSSLKDIE